MAPLKVPKNEAMKLNKHSLTWPKTEWEKDIRIYLMKSYILSR